jgi:hypothetical protein
MGRGGRFSGAMRRHAEQRLLAEELARRGDRHGVEAQVDAIRCQRPGHVDPAIDQELHLAPTLARSVVGGFAELLGEKQQLAAVQATLADLHPVHARSHRLANRLGERLPSHAPITDQAEDRSARGQNDASPSSGLEAVAYRRRGMRPAS